MAIHRRVLVRAVRQTLAIGLMTTATTVAASAQPAVQVFASCPVTLPGASEFVPPAPYPSKAPSLGSFWYGTPRLWTMLQRSATWERLPRNGQGFRQKVFVWRPGFDGRREPSPALVVRGRRLNGDGSFVAARATNASDESFGGWAMLTGVDLPSSGCWELTAEYGSESITFVVRVAE